MTKKSLSIYNFENKRTLPSPATVLQKVGGGGKVRLFSKEIIKGLELYKNDKKFKNNQIVIHKYKDEITGITVDFNNNKKKNKKTEFFMNLLGYGVKLKKLKYDKKNLEVSFIWNAFWMSNYKKDKKTNCSCFEKVNDKYRLVFKSEKEFDTFEESYQKQCKT
mgnify:FL=1